MPRPIKLTDEIKQKARDDFSAMLEDVTDGKINYCINLNYENLKAAVWLTCEAYNKIVALVTEFSEEVGWHGTVTRLSDNEFVIEDIFVYPQEVTKSTVVTDQTLYTDWLYRLNDEVFSTLRMQGHSHVNMGVSPSAVDDKHRAGILEQLEQDMFYIFMVWNKSLSIYTIIYDMANNIIYEDRDIDVRLLYEGADEFMTDAKSKVKNKVYSTKKNKKSKEETDFDLAEYGYYPFDQYDIGGNAWGL